MWRRRLTTLWASKACYRDSFYLSFKPSFRNFLQIRWPQWIILGYSSNPNTNCSWALHEKPLVAQEYDKRDFINSSLATQRTARLRERNAQQMLAADAFVESVLLEKSITKYITSLRGFSHRWLTTLRFTMIVWAVESFRLIRIIRDFIEMYSLYWTFRQTSWIPQIHPISLFTKDSLAILSSNL
jgi:hypothetical protein